MKHTVYLIGGKTEYQEAIFKHWGVPEVKRCSVACDEQKRAKALMLTFDGESFSYDRLLDIYVSNVSAHPTKRTQIICNDSGAFYSLSHLVTEYLDIAGDANGKPIRISVILSNVDYNKPNRRIAKCI